MLIAGGTTYYEKKLTTESSGASSDGYNYVPVGSYDFVVEESTHVTFDNVKQYNVNHHIDDGGNIVQMSEYTGIADDKYWGNKNWYGDILPINPNSNDPNNYMTNEIEKGIKIIPQRNIKNEKKISVFNIGFSNTYCIFIIRML